jgi:hypothetical protein
MAMTFRTNVMGYQILLHSEVLFSKSPFNIIKFSYLYELLLIVKYASLVYSKVC